MAIWTYPEFSANQATAIGAIDSFASIRVPFVNIMIRSKYQSIYVI